MTQPQHFGGSGLNSEEPLNGHLNLSKWVREAPLKPTQFPVDRDELTVDNDFARGLSLACGLFRRSTRDATLNARLKRLETAVLPGTALPAYVNPAVTHRKLPAQWNKYLPAWDIAVAMLRNRTVVGDPGHSTGLEIAIEPWPLLETLLERTLHELASDPLFNLEVPAKGRFPLLRTTDGRVAGSVEPDGVLKRDGQTIATFEAKYTDPPEIPWEGHRYQALTAAAALHAQLAILVYPGNQAPKTFAVDGFNGEPGKLVTMGLDMYSYEHSTGDHLRAGRVRRVLEEHGLI